MVFWPSRWLTANRWSQQLRPLLPRWGYWRLAFGIIRKSHNTIISFYFVFHMSKRNNTQFLTFQAACFRDLGCEVHVCGDVPFKAVPAKKKRCWRGVCVYVCWLLLQTGYNQNKWNDIYNILFRYWFNSDWRVGSNRQMKSTLTE